MMRRNNTWQSVILITILLFTAYGCQQSVTPSDPFVSVSIQPVKYFVDRLSDGALEVNVMVPAGTSHSTYSPTPQQFQRLSDSGLYIRIGYLGYEQAWIKRLREFNPKMEVLNLSDHTGLIRGGEVDHGDHRHEGGIDPHIWMSPAVMKTLLPLIKDAIISVYPGIQDTVEENYITFAGEIDRLDQAFRDLTSQLGRKTFMIYHPALTYLARDYGLHQISIEHEGKEPSPALMAQIIRQAREQSIPVIFIQQEYDMRSAVTISEETGAYLAQINPEAYNWIASMEELLQLFEEHLQ